REVERSSEHGNDRILSTERRRSRKGVSSAAACVILARSRPGASMQTPGHDRGEFQRMSLHKNEKQSLSRRTFLKGMGMSALLFRASPFFGYPLLSGRSKFFPDQASSFSFADFRLTPHYPAKSPLEDVLRRVTPGTDEYITEKYAFEIDTLLKRWSQALKISARDFSALVEI